MPKHLASSGLIHTPGMIANIRHMWRTGDHERALDILAAGWPEITVEDAHDLIHGRYTVEGETLIIADREKVS